MSITPEVINVGTAPNDGEGDPLRVAFTKVNNNFSNLFTTFLNSSIANTTGANANQIIFQYPANAFTQGQFYIQSKNPNTGNSQTIQINSQLNNTGNAVSFVGYASTFIGDPVTEYNMDVSSGNIRILVSPLQSANLTHFVSSQVMWTGAI